MLRNRGGGGGSASNVTFCYIGGGVKTRFWALRNMWTVPYIHSYAQLLPYILELLSRILTILILLLNEAKEMIEEVALSILLHLFWSSSPSLNTALIRAKKRRICLPKGWNQGKQHEPSNAIWHILKNLLEQPCGSNRGQHIHKSDQRFHISFWEWGW